MNINKVFALKLLMLVLSYSAFGQNTSWSWAIQSDGVGSESINPSNGIEEDSEGNFIIAGTFDNDISFANQMIEYTGGLFTPFIAKINPQGEFLWFKTIGDPNISFIFVQDFALDSDDNIYFNLSFFGPASLDLGNGIILELEEGQNGVFIAKLNANGEAQWARNYNVNSEGAILNSELEIFEDSIVFGGGLINVLSINDITLPSLPGTGDAFLSKLDLDGNAYWATTLGGYSNEQSLDFKVNNQGDIYATLSWTGDTLFAQDQYLVNEMPTFSPFGGNSDRALIKFDRNGNVQWMRSEASDEPENPGIILTCNDGGVLMTSTNIGGITVNDVELPQNSATIVKYSESGSVDFITTFPANENLIGPIASEVELNNFYLSFGFIEDQFPIGEFTLQNSAPGSGTSDIGLIKLNSDGDIVWADRIGSSDNDSPIVIYPVSDGGYLLGGRFAGENLSLGDNVLENVGEFTNNIFIAKFDVAAGIGSILKESNIYVFPNPSNEFINVSLIGLSGKKIKAKILTIQGQVISEEIWDTNSGDYRRNCSDLKSGVYIIEFSNDKSIATSKFVIQH